MNLVEAIKYTSSIREKQYVVGKISAIDTKYLPREKQLFISCQTVSSDKSKLYKTQLVFDGITNSDTQDKIHLLPYSSHGKGVELYLKQVLVTDKFRTRCNCSDYYYMWSFFNKKNKALIGPHKQYVPVSPPSGRPPVNPTESPGACKHILALIKKLMLEDVIKKDTKCWSYLNQPVRK